MKNIKLCVTNDLVSDQRVHKICSSLVNAGFDVTLVGRRLRTSLPLSGREYKTKRFRFVFNKGFLFYAAYNIRLLFYLLFTKVDIITANDLDTLFAANLAARIRGKKLVYDSHEYFTEVPELIDRKFVKSFWLRIEQSILPKMKYSSTVNKSLADIYNEKYGIDMKVVRNIPSLSISGKRPSILPDFGLRRLIIYQGALNMGRGLEHVIEAMRYVENAIFLVVGDGDIADQLKVIACRPGLEERVVFTGKRPFEELPFITPIANIGISLEENMGLNYYYALPNKLFDYIRAEVPVLVSRLPEMQRLVEEEGIGLMIDSHDPEHIALRINQMLDDEGSMRIWKSRLRSISGKYCWENEEKILLKIYLDLG